MNRREQQTGSQRRLSALGRAVVVFLAVVLMGSLPSAVVTTANAQITVRGRLAHDVDATPGQVVSGSITVDNETQDVQQARIYLRDYLFFADGSNSYDEPGTAPRSNAAWVSFSPQNLTVPPGGSVDVSYEILIPADAGPGSWWCMLMVEAVDPNSAESTTGEETLPDRQVGFRQVTRYGVQLAVHLNDQAERNVEFDGIRLLADEDGSTWFQADVINTGTLMIRPEAYMRVFDAEGNEFGPFEGVQYRMYPGTSVRQRIDLSELVSGTYQVLLIVDNGDDAVFGGQYELTL